MVELVIRWSAKPVTRVQIPFLPQSFLKMFLVLIDSKKGFTAKVYEYLNAFLAQ